MFGSKLAAAIRVPNYTPEFLAPRRLMERATPQSWVEHARMLCHNFGIIGGTWGVDIVTADNVGQNFPPKNRKVPLEEFPGLFAMQGHTGACGAFFTLVWFGFALIFFPNLWINGGSRLIACTLFVFSVFFGLLWIGFSLPNYLTKEIKELDLSTKEGRDWKDKLESRVRIWTAWFSGSYVVACCVLIWMTGGATSPFVPFYIMIFTLTIAKNQISKPGIGRWVLAYFIILIVLACIVAELAPTVIAKVDMDDIKRSGFQITMHIVFICASLIVPTLSAYSLELRMKKTLKPAPAAATV